jgi:hypothetical protein
VYTLDDQRRTTESGAKAWLLSFDANRPDPKEFAGASKYLREGAAAKIDRRYKTSIRAPWYRVPSVWGGAILLSKRCHRFPRLIHNDAGVVTTDTIYRGRAIGAYAGHEPLLVASFHNSVTLLAAELDGRSFGGGVLELVPSEISQLLVPVRLLSTANLARLDALARGLPPGSGRTEDELVVATDELILANNPTLDPGALATLQTARAALVERRLRRN